MRSSPLPFPVVSTHACIWMASVAMLLLAAACGQPPLLKRHDVNGAALRLVAGRADTSVVLLYSPADCFVCYGALQPWLDWDRQNPDRVALVFTRLPHSSEKVQLATYRIRPDAVLRPRLLDRFTLPETPAELLIVKGEVVSTRTVRRGTLASPLYLELTGRRARRDAESRGNVPASAIGIQ